MARRPRREQSAITGHWGGGAGKQRTTGRPPATGDSVRSPTAWTPPSIVVEDLHHVPQSRVLSKITKPCGRISRADHRRTRGEGIGRRHVVDQGSLHQTTQSSRPETRGFGGWMACGKGQLITSKLPCCPWINAGSWYYAGDIFLHSRIGRVERRDQRQRRTTICDSIEPSLTT